MGCGHERELDIAVDGDAIAGTLRVPDRASGLVVFAHGSGSGRGSPRNRWVASKSSESGFATLLIDLLTAPEERYDRSTARLRFDIDLLAGRLVASTRRARGLAGVGTLPTGYFGASTGAAAALVAAAELASEVAAVVSRGGRPDLAGRLLPKVRAPALLIVGELDPTVLELNRDALRALNAQSRLEIVPRAGHLFEEPAALEEVARLASAWFERYLAAR